MVLSHGLRWVSQEVSVQHLGVLTQDDAETQGSPRHLLFSVGRSEATGHCSAGRCSSLVHLLCADGILVLGQFCCHSVRGTWQL